MKTYVKPETFCLEIEQEVIMNGSIISGGSADPELPILSKGRNAYQWSTTAEEEGIFDSGNGLW